MDIAMKKYQKWIPILILFSVIVLLWTFMNGRGQYTWDNLQDSRLQFTEDIERSGNQYGVMNTGPALSIGGGKYTLTWDIETDADNIIRLTTTNRAAITPDEIIISANQPRGYAEFTSLDEIYNLQILVDYQAGSYIKVNRIDLIGHRVTDRLFTITFFLLAAAILYVFAITGHLTPRRRGMLLILALSVLIASIPDLRSNLHTGHDSQFHMGRLLNLVHGLRSGQFPVRLGTYMQNGYGAIMSVYYPEVFLYFPAVMIMLGASFTYSYHVFFIAMHLTAAITMWYAASRMLKSEAEGTAASILYTLAQYRLLDVYTRFAIGESLAMSFLPLFALGLYEVIWGDKKRWKLLAVSATLICQSHLISTVMCGVIALCIALAACVHLIRDRRILPLLKAAVTALLLNVFFFAPLYTYSQQNIVTSWMVHDLSQEAVEVAQLFLPPVVNAQIHDAAFPNCSIGIGLPLIVAACAALYAAAIKEKRNQHDWFAILVCMAGVLCSWMATKQFPWHHLTTITGGMIAYIQFPWRMLMFVSFCFALAGGYAIRQLDDKHADVMQFTLVALCALWVLPMLSNEIYKESYLKAGSLPYYDQRFGDYCLPGANLRALDVKEPIVSDGIEISEYKKYGTQITAQVSAQQDGTVVLPLYAFDGYQAKLGDVSLDIGQNKHAHMMLQLKENMQGTLSIRFAGKDYWRIFDWISLLTAMFLMSTSLHDQYSKARKKR